MRRFLPLFLLLALLLSACGTEPQPATPTPAPAGNIPFPPVGLASAPLSVKAAPVASQDLASGKGLPSKSDGELRQTALAVPDGWVVLLDEDFQNPDPEMWETGGDERAKSELRDGELRIDAQVGWMSSTHAKPATDLKDAYISATFTIEGQGSAGVMARLGGAEETTTMYACWVENPNVFACYRLKDGYWAKLIVAESTAVRATGENTVTLQMVGTNLVFAVNGQAVTSIVDGELASGAWGVFAQGGEGAATAHFTHVLVAGPGNGQPVATPAQPQPTETVGANGRLVSLDPSFGNGGTETMDFGSTLDQANAIVVQPDGKIVVGGESWPKQMPGFTLARLNPDGSLDESFGDKGRVFTSLIDQYDYSGIRALALQPDGKLLAAGYARNPESGRPAFGLVRYNADGSLDASFGKGGIAITTVDPTSTADTEDQAYALALAPDGKILVAGSTTYYPSDFAVARYLPNGKLDASFGKKGVAITDFAGAEDIAYAVTVQPDGKIIAAGLGTPGESGIDNNDFAMVRYNPDGSLDRKFGKQGKVTTNLSGQHDEARSLVLRPDGKIILGGAAKNGTKFCAYGDVCWRYGMALAQYNTDGSLDASFGNKGAMIVPDAGGMGFALLRLPGGTLALGGYTGDTHAALGLFTADGKPVAGFGDKGILVNRFSAYQSHIYALALQPDGRIVAAGNAAVDPDDILNADFALLRYR